MSWPCARTRAYLLLWVVFAAIVYWQRGAVQPVTITRGDQQIEPFCIYINRDPWQRLLLLEGIGPKLAQRIIDERESRGSFRTLEEVMRIPGIPDRPLQRARGWIRLD